MENIIPNFYYKILSILPVYQSALSNYKLNTISKGLYPFSSMVLYRKVRRVSAGDKIE